MTVRLATLLAALLLALTVPTAALGQGAGDDQYTDPFGSGQNDSGEEPAQDPDTPTSSDDQAAPAPAAPAPSASAAPSQESAGGGQGQLPYTGADAGLLALSGALLLAAGVALRLRLRGR
jgi:LPXTG-motif cell wall-anchored protein